MPLYSLSGIRLRSALPLASLAEADSAGAADLPTIDHAVDSLARQAPLASSQILAEITIPSSPPRPYLSIARQGEAFMVRAHGHADFLVSRDGLSIRTGRLAGQADQTIEQLLLDQILPRVLQLHGRPCFHASAVAHPRHGVIAFLGPSGSGKSTLCAALAHSGDAASIHQQASILICDDCLSVQLDDDSGRVLGLPSYPSIRLWADSAAALYGDLHGFAAASPRTSKRRVAMKLSSSARLPLRAIYLLEQPDDDDASCARLPAQQAAASLLGHLHRLEPDDRQVLATEFEILTAIAESVPVARLRYPRRYDALPEVCRALEVDLDASESSSQ